MVLLEAEGVVGLPVGHGFLIFFTFWRRHDCKHGWGRRGLTGNVPTHMKFSSTCTRMGYASYTRRRALIVDPDDRGEFTT